MVNVQIQQSNAGHPVMPMIDTSSKGTCRHLQTQRHGMVHR